MKWQLPWGVRHFVVAACAAAAGTAAGYPARPVRLIVAAAPGGGGDITARLITPKLGEFLGQQVIVDNRPGASTMIGTEAVARATPDGYTLLMGAGNLATNPAIQKKMPYDAPRDFAPIVQLIAAPNFIVVHPSVPVRSVKEFIEFARVRPGQLDYASSGHGSNGHLAMELLILSAKLKLVHVPYKGVGPGLADLVAGHVQVMQTSVLSSLSYVRAGRLNALGVTSAGRSPAAPAVPTIAEAGVPGYDATQWFGLLAPAATPRGIVTRLHVETARVLRDAPVRERFEESGAIVVGSNPDEFAAFIRAEIAKWARVVAQAGIIPQ
ncbi:MAG: tripartite tricarboxylate transporter substrate binding protein [Burkholderiales bacterium]|nr:tripartite tricarboxylate transporter substrate binding protein [Burkholderiales bacterium]